MESKIKELEDRHVEVYQKLLSALDELSLLRRGAKPQDKAVLLTRRQVQSSLTMTIPMIHAMTNDGTLDKRLTNLMEENFQVDNEVAENQNERLSLLQKIGEQRVRYAQLVDSTRKLAQDVKDNTGSGYTESESEDVDEKLELENEALKEMIIGIILQSGYQGTNPLIDEWLEFL